VIEDIVKHFYHYRLLCIYFIANNSNVCQLLPPPSAASQRYNMRERSHSLQLPEHSAHLSDCNFIIRTLYKNAH